MDISKQLVDQYIAGNLKGQALLDFKKRLESDTQLKEMVAERRKVLSGQSSSITSTAKKGGIAKWLIAIGIVGLIATVLFFTLKPAQKAKKSLKEDILTEYYEAYYPVFSKEENSDAVVFTKLNGLMKAKKYEAAISILEEELAVKKASNLNLALGTCYLESGKYNKAVKQFKTAKENVLYQDKAYWYTALTYVKEGKWKKAQKELSPLIANAQSEFHQKAKDLSVALDNKGK